jgi:hypothetical protein
VDVGGTGATGATLFYLRAGKVTRLVVYADRELALADVGLSSETRSTKS